MKKILLALSITALLISCNNGNKKETVEEEVVVAENTAMNYQSFGDEITNEAVLTKAEIMEKYKNLKPGDTVTLKFRADVKEVCQNKGCWMKVNVGEGEEAMVKFKDYGFFMPKDIAGQEVIMEGKAFVEEMSVEEQRHYAEDAGKTKEEIAAITEPKRTLSFESSGVLVPATEAVENQE